MNTAIAFNSMPSNFTDELKLPYKNNLRKGLIFAIIIHFFVIGIYAGAYYYGEYVKEQEQKNTQQRIINVTLTDLEPPPSLTDEEEMPPVKLDEITPPAKDLEALEPEPVAKEKADVQTIKTQQQLEDIKTPVSSVGDTGTFTYSGTVKIEEKKIEEKVKVEKVVEVKEKTVYQSFEVEKAPDCVNLNQVRNSMTYPPMAIEAQIEGRVTVKVLVGPDGSVIKVGSVSGPEVFRDEVSQKSRMLQFTPGLQNGKPVKVWVTVPFNFKLTK